MPFPGQAAAYYFHGLILDEGETRKSQEMAIAALQASEEFLNESKRASNAFHTAPPASRSLCDSKSSRALFILFGTLLLGSKPTTMPSILLYQSNT